MVEKLVNTLPEYYIPEETGYEWGMNKKIVHFIISARPYTDNERERERKHPDDDSNSSNVGLPENSIIFGATRKVRDNDADKVEDICREAIAIANERSVIPPSEFTPIDISYSEQCWIVVELDHRINWQFSRGDVACTQKVTNIGPESGDNFYLRHVCLGPDGEYYCHPTVVREECRVLFFGMAFRKKANKHEIPNPGGFPMNFRVEFYQDLGKESDRPCRILQIVLDPDVGNDGNEQIPPP